MDALVSLRQKAERKFSMNDWIVDAIRFKVDYHASVSLQWMPALPEDLDEWEAKCITEFGHILARAGKSIARWSRMTWQQRYEELDRQRETAG